MEHLAFLRLLLVLTHVVVHVTRLIYVSADITLLLFVSPIFNIIIINQLSITTYQ